jgi:formylglycine-generating enzyme required for sulfatase activity
MRVPTLRHRWWWLAVAAALVVAAVIVGIAVRPTPSPQSATSADPSDSADQSPARVAALSLEPIEPVTLVAGEEKTLDVPLRRENCPGRVTLDVGVLPPGVRALTSESAREGSDPRLMLSADLDADGADTLVGVTARAGDVRGEGGFRLVLTPSPPIKDRPAPVDCTRGDGVPLGEMRRAQQKWARYLGRKVEQTVEVARGVQMTFVLVPPGKYVMGSPETEADRSDDEMPHTVILTRAFDLAKYEVTRVQYEAAGGTDPSRIEDAGLPVEQVSWDQAVAFATALTQRRLDGHTYRLPTEAEWEYACRGGRSSRFPFGVGDGLSLSSGEANFDGTHPAGAADRGPFLRHATKPGSYAANALGLCDLHGNVCEWCADFYGNYPRGEVIDPRGQAAGLYRVMRGGGWSSTGAACRAALRGRSVPGLRVAFIGFRLARTLPQPAK